MQDLNEFYLLSDFYQEAGFLVKRNKATLNDNIMLGSLGMSDEVNFYSINRKSSNLGSINVFNQYLSIFIALDQQIDYYT